MKLLYFAFISTLVLGLSLQEGVKKDIDDDVGKFLRILDTQDLVRDRKPSLKYADHHDDSDDGVEEELADHHREKRSPRRVGGGSRYKPAVKRYTPVESKRTSSKVVVYDSQRRKGNPSGKVAAAAAGGAVLGAAAGSSLSNGRSNGKKSNSPDVFGKHIKNLLCAVIAITLAIWHYLR